MENMKKCSFYVLSNQMANITPIELKLHKVMGKKTSCLMNSLDHPKREQILRKKLNLVLNDY